MLVVLLCWLVAPIASGQSENPPERQSLRELLLEVEQSLSLLRQRLAERQQQVTLLQQRLAEAEQRLADSQMSSIASAERLAGLEWQLLQAQQSLEASQKGLQETQSSLDALQKRYDELSRDWVAYREEMQRQVKEVQLERNLWRAAGISGWLLALAMTIFAAVR